MTDESLELEGGTLRYLRGGAGPLIVFSHALGPLAWGGLERLQQSCTVVIPDWERSTVPVRTMAGLGWYEAVADSLGFQQAALCAWSMAGPAAIYYAAEQPARLSHLVLVDVAGMGEGFPPMRLLDWPHLLMTWLRGHPTRGFVRCMWRDWLRQDHVDKKPLVEATYRFFRDTASAFEGLSDEDDDEEEDMMNDELPEIVVPTLVLTGTYSTVMGPEVGRAAAKKLPNGQHIEFEESAHSLPLEEPEKFQEVVATFVSSRGNG